MVDSSNKTAGFVDNAVATDDYTYDVNGNMISDANKNITSITYNHLNLPVKITFATTGNIVYLYNAAGQKVQKIVTVISPASVTTTDYLGGYQYDNSALKFFPMAEGYVEPVSGSYKYVYQYKDHLGNVRLSYDKTLAIKEESNFYPFGLKQEGYNTVKTGVENKYKYNGKELQDELGLNFYDYGARNYDPALGRWMNIDEKAESLRSFSPYTYALNNPIYFVDPDGMLTQSFINTLMNSASGTIWTNNNNGTFSSNTGETTSDGETPTWIDNGNGTYTSEKGDSAWSLYEQFLKKEGYSWEDIQDVVKDNLYLNYDYKGTLRTQINPGSIVAVKELQDAAIKLNNMKISLIRNTLNINRLKKENTKLLAQNKKSYDEVNNYGGEANKPAGGDPKGGLVLSYLIRYYIMDEENDARQDKVNKNKVTINNLTNQNVKLTNRINSLKNVK